MHYAPKPKSIKAKPKPIIPGANTAQKTPVTANAASPKTKKVKTEAQIARKERKKVKQTLKREEKAKADTEAAADAAATTPGFNRVSQTASVTVVPIKADDAAAEKARADKVAKKLSNDQKTSQEIKAKKQKKLTNGKARRNAVNHKQVIAEIDTKIDTIIADEKLGYVEKQKQIGELQLQKSKSEEAMIYRNIQNISKNQISINSLQKQIDEVQSDPKKIVEYSNLMLAKKNAMEALEKKKAGLNNQSKFAVQQTNIIRQQKKNNKTRKAQEQAQGQAQAQTQGQTQGQTYQPNTGVRVDSAPVTKTAPQAALEQATAALQANATTKNQSNNSQPKGKTEKQLLLEQKHTDEQQKLADQQSEYTKKASDEQRKMEEYMKANPGKTYKNSGLLRIFTRSISRNREKARIAGVNLERNQNKFKKDLIDLNKKTEANFKGDQKAEIVAARIINEQEKSKRLAEAQEADYKQAQNIKKREEDAWKQYKKNNPPNPNLYPNFMITRGADVIEVKTT